MSSIKNKVSVYLIKEDVMDFDEVIDEKKNLNIINIDDDTVICFSESVINNPDWVSSFFNDDEILIENLKSSNSRALLLKKIFVKESESRIFAVPFGYGKYMMKSDTIEKQVWINYLTKYNK